MYVFCSWVVSNAFKKACLILQDLHLEISSLVIYPSCFFSYNIVITHMVLDTKFFYLNSGGQKPLNS